MSKVLEESNGSNLNAACLRHKFFMRLTFWRRGVGVSSSGRVWVYV